MQYRTWNEMELLEYARRETIENLCSYFRLQQNRLAGSANERKKSNLDSCNQKKEDSTYHKYKLCLTYNIPLLKSEIIYN
ncbi:hypothetical protein BLOT_000109 [Blomia tropicalis]|nr:hypothetical protein BLOT_000109 [Blomia tropicalis]